MTFFYNILTKINIFAGGVEWRGVSVFFWGGGGTLTLIKGERYSTTPIVGVG